MAGPGQHTTIGVVATNARLSAAQVERLAQDADDGIARAMRPAHTAFDGDTIYGLSTAVPNDVAGSAGADTNKFVEITVEAADVYSRAITHAIINAKNLGVAETYCERFPTACPPPGQAKKGAAAGSAAGLDGPSSGEAVQPTDDAGGLSVPLTMSALLAALMVVLAAAVTRPGRSLAVRLVHAAGFRKPASARSSVT
jgi:hypothetical protein